MTRPPSKDFKPGELDFLQDADAAAVYLEDCLADGDLALFKAALKDVAEARLGGVAALAEETGYSRETLYRTLSAQGNPKLDTLNDLLHAMGLRIAVAAEAVP